MMYRSQSSASFILMLLFVCFSDTKILLQRLNLTTFNSQSNITFSPSFLATPEFTFFVESLQLNASEIKISHTLKQINKDNALVQFKVEGQASSFSSSSFIELGLLFSDEGEMEIGIHKINETESTLQYAQNHGNQYYIKFFLHALPFDYDLTQNDATSARISIKTKPSTLNFPLEAGYLLLRKSHLSNNVFVVFEQIVQNNANFLVQIDDEGYLQPDSQNTALVLLSYDHYNSNITLEKYSNHEYGGTTIAVGYYLEQPTAHLNAILISFNPLYTYCSSGSLFQYLVPYTTIPKQCTACHQSCLTCVTSADDASYTNEYFCTSCGEYRYFSPSQQDPTYGQCPCYRGLQVSASGQCVPCQYSCLSFGVQFMRASTTPEFLLIFTQSQLTFQVSLESNLEILIEGQSEAYSLEKIRDATYLIQIDADKLLVCEDVCFVQFRIKNPQTISSNGKYLTKQNQIIQIRNYYSVNDELPDQLNEAFLISSLLIGTSAAAGQTSFIKMLFEVQQMIQFHKYLNLDIPVVFKEFVEALASFKFLDLALALPIDITEEMKKLSSDQMDNKGPYKVVYYENGANFYKNIIAAIFTFVVMLFLNFLLFLIFRFCPCQLLKSFSQKIRLRWLITLSDSLQTLIIPVSLFGIFQLSYIVFSSKFLWIYALMVTLCWIMLVFPFLVIIHVEASSKKGTIKKELLQDLFQDVDIKSRASYVAYMLSFGRKFFFAMFLTPALPGLIQINLLIFVNLMHFFFIAYIVLNRLFTSKLKVITRAINILSIIVLELVILIYNINYSAKENMIGMGITCTYLTIIATITGILELFIKIGEIIMQKIKKNAKEKQDQSDEQRQPIVCNMGRPLDFIYEIEESQENEESEKSQIIELETRNVTSPEKKTKKIYPVVEEKKPKIPAAQFYNRQARNRQQFRARKRPVYQDENSSNSEIVDLN